MTISYQEILVTLILQLFIFFLFANFIKTKVNEYNAIQKIHDGQIPRIGGLIFFIPFLIFIFFNFSKFTFNIIPILVSVFIIFVVSFYEDIKQSLTPKFRLIVLFIVILFYCYLTELPDINIPILEYFVQFNLIKYFLFTLSLMLIINGFNLIDGLNGLNSFNFLSILLTNYYLAYLFNDAEVIYFISNISILVLLTLLFNFPVGKVFLGDSGSYTYAFLAGVITMLIFQRNPEIPTLLALILLSYPITEMLFSIIRKLSKGLSPTKPDINHLHHLVFKLLRGNDLLRNNLSSILLIPIWLSPSLITYISINYHIANNLILYIAYFFFYSSVYIIISKKRN